MPAPPLKIPLLARPPGKALVIMLLTGMVLLWTLLMAISHSAPDLDGMEELVWAASLELGYAKHPPLPSWFMYLAGSVLGRPVWLSFLMGLLFSALGLWFVWRLGCEMATPRLALIATLLVSATTYFSLRGTIYNHNTAQLWTICASIYFFYRALRHGRNSDWIWLGVVSGLAMLTKYSALIQFTAFFLYLWRSGALGHKGTWYGMGLASLAFVLVISPHVWWLAQHEFEPLRYADASLHAKDRLAALIALGDFVLTQTGRISPMLLVLVLWSGWHRLQRDHAPGHAANDESFDPARAADSSAPLWYRLRAADRQFLLWVGLTPLFATLAVSAAMGNKLEASWGSTFFVLYGFYGLMWLRGPETVQLWRVLILVAALHLLMAAGYAMARGPLAHMTGYPARSTYPGPELAALALKHWQEHQPGRPLRVVVANTWLGGNIAIHAGPQAQVYIDGSDKQSPWFQPGAALQCGALVAFSEQGRGAPSARVRELYGQAPWKGLDEIAWSGPKGRTIDFNWAVLPAGPDCLKDQRAVMPSPSE